MVVVMVLNINTYLGHNFSTLEVRTLRLFRTGRCYKKKKDTVIYFSIVIGSEEHTLWLVT